MEKRTITVKDKAGNLIATFSNEDASNTDEAKRNLMISPTIDIVQNGESTLSFQMLADSEKWQQIKNPENRYYCNGRVYTALNEQSIQYSGKVVNVMLVEEWYLLAYKYVQAHNVDTSKESIDDHTVKILPKTDASKFKLTVNGTKYEDSQVKDSRGVTMPRGSAGYALWAILKGSGWSLGVCDVLPDGFSAANDYGSFNVETDMKDVLYNIQFIQQLYGGILDWDSENKVLNLRDETKEGTDFNTWKGYSIRKGKNISDYPTIVWDNNLITRLYPLGNGNLNIKKVNNNKGYVDDFSYTTAVYEGYLQNPNIYDTNDEGGQKTLKYWGEQQVKKRCKPRKTISYNITDTSSVESDFHEEFDINDIAKAYYLDDTGAETSEFLRIYHISQNWFFPSDDSVIEVGDKISNEVELFYQVYKQAENSIPTDANGHVSGGDIYLEVPEEYWDELFNGVFGYASLQEITNLHAQKETETSQSLADFKVYAEETYALASMSATYAYVDQQTGELRQNIASVKATADAASSMVNAIASGGIQGSAYLSLYQDPTNASASLGVSSGGNITVTGYVSITSPSSIVINGASVSLLGQECYWSNGYLRGR